MLFGRRGEYAGRLGGGGPRLEVDGASLFV